MASVERIGPAPSVRTSAPVAASAIVARVRHRLGLMLVLIATAAVVAVAALATMVVRKEAAVAIVTAAVMLSVALVVAAAVLAERRSLRRDAALDRRAHNLTSTIGAPGPSKGKGTEWIGEPAASAPQDVRGQADLLEELLEWPQRRGA